jgi:hypothetical protein
MLQQIRIWVCVSLMLLAACAPAQPTLLPTPALTPSPTSIPSPTPTVTPIPWLVLTIRWPEQVSALQPVPIEVELVPPPGVAVTAALRASVLDPTGRSRLLFDLTPRGANLYAAEELLQLPLEPPEGDWQLSVGVRSALPVDGEQVLVFRPAPIPFRDLTADLPAGVDIRVPRDFVEVVTQGDRWAGGRVWRYGDGEVALWWAPGPVEPLMLDNAVVMLEATHDPDAPPGVRGVEEREWQGRVAYLFCEDWPGADGGPAEALVVQDLDYLLYVLRVRTVGGTAISPLLRQVGETFSFVAE